MEAGVGGGTLRSLAGAMDWGDGLESRMDNPPGRFDPKCLPWIAVASPACRHSSGNGPANAPWPTRSLGGRTGGRADLKAVVIWEGGGVPGVSRPESNSPPQTPTAHPARRSCSPRPARQSLSNADFAEGEWKAITTRAGGWSADEQRSRAGRVFGPLGRTAVGTRVGDSHVRVAEAERASWAVVAVPGILGW